MTEDAASEHVALTVTVMRLLDDWGVEPESQIQLLGLSSDTRPRFLRRFREGAPLPGDAEVMQRINCLLSIERAVRTAFPHSESMAQHWITTPNHQFGGRTPLEAMLGGGLATMQAVVSQLSGSSEWG